MGRAADANSAPRDGAAAGRASRGDVRGGGLVARGEARAGDGGEQRDRRGDGGGARRARVPRDPALQHARGGRAGDGAAGGGVGRLGGRHNPGRLPVSGGGGGRLGARRRGVGGRAGLPGEQRGRRDEAGGDRGQLRGVGRNPRGEPARALPAGLRRARAHATGLDGGDGLLGARDALGRVDVGVRRLEGRPRQPHEDARRRVGSRRRARRGRRAGAGPRRADARQAVDPRKPRALAAAPSARPHGYRGRGRRRDRLVGLVARERLDHRPDAYPRRRPLGATQHARATAPRRPAARPRPLREARRHAPGRARILRRPAPKDERPLPARPRRRPHRGRPRRGPLRRLQPPGAGGLGRRRRSRVPLRAGPGRDPLGAVRGRRHLRQVPPARQGPRRTRRPHRRRPGLIRPQGSRSTHAPRDRGATRLRQEPLNLHAQLPLSLFFFLLFEIYPSSCIHPP
mmetsp:Transcript_5590/g.16899  ORF Transcript_5590/g.16899 Transcript_5590/m.16899 type:complete len:457 (+) Transcript_5590:102-1472(+)